MFEQDPTQVAEEVEEVQETPVEEPKEAETPVVETPQEEITMPPPRPKKTAAERIAEITREKWEARREAERLKKQLEEREAKPTTDEPQFDQFQTQEEYVKAMVKYEVGKRDKERAIESQKEKESRLKTEFDRKAATFKKEYEDFDEVINQEVYSQPMQEVIFKSDNGAMLAYYLGRPENMEINEKIRSLPPTEQIYELGKLEEKLLIAKKNKASNAPAPIKPVGETGGRAAIDESKMTDQEWIEHRRKQRMEQIKNKTGV